MVETYEEWESSASHYSDWKCKYCKESFDKQTENTAWQLHKIGHKITDVTDLLERIARVLETTP